jgi:flavin reductase (DIM6/NTAB) family NADH-FMN oxidoreductase RutF
VPYSSAPLRRTGVGTRMRGENGTGAFERLVATLDYPMFVVCTRAHGTDDPPAGCLVGFASQTSIDPPRFLVGLSRLNHTYRIAENAKHLAVHVVSRRDRRLAELFGEQTGDRIDKFDHCDWSPGPAGMPILTAAAAWFVGRIVDRFDLGDHVGHLLEPVSGMSPDGIEDWCRSPTCAISHPDTRRRPESPGTEWRECKAKSAGHVSPHRLRIYRLQIVPASGV